MEGVEVQSAARPSPLIRLENVHLRFGLNEVLRNLDLTINKGETLLIVGESGCGKTVLLKLIIGLLRASSGRVVFDGRAWPEMRDRFATKQRLRFGFLFQGAALFDSLTVFDNVAFALRQHTRTRPAQIREQVQRRLAEVGLPADVEKKKPAELSGGMKKRVGMARALVFDPEVMLYDEPTTGLDPIMSDVINELVLQTSRRPNVTSIAVTHDMRTVQKLAGRIVMLYPLSRLKDDEPQIIFNGGAEELRHCDDPRVRQFVEGEARERMQE